MKGANHLNNTEPLTRQELIAETGVFMTPDYFNMVNSDFEESTLSKDDFINNFPETVIGEICETSDANQIKYLINDTLISGIDSKSEKDIEDWTSLDIIEDLALECDFQKRRYEDAMQLLVKACQQLSEARCTIKIITSPPSTNIVQ